jgi:hypothetical protein
MEVSTPDNLTNDGRADAGFEHDEKGSSNANGNELVCSVKVSANGILNALACGDDEEIAIWIENRFSSASEIDDDEASASEIDDDEASASEIDDDEASASEIDDDEASEILNGSDHENGSEGRCEAMGTSRASTVEAIVVLSRLIPSPSLRSEFLGLSIAHQ